MNRRSAPDGTFLVTADGDESEFTIGILVVSSPVDAENTITLYPAIEYAETGRRSTGDALVLPAHVLGALADALLRSKAEHERFLRQQLWS